MGGEDNYCFDDDSTAVTISAIDGSDSNGDGHRRQRAPLDEAQEEGVRQTRRCWRRWGRERPTGEGDEKLPNVVARHAVPNANIDWDTFGFGLNGVRTDSMWVNPVTVDDDGQAPYSPRSEPMYLRKSRILQEPGSSLCLGGSGIALRVPYVCYASKFSNWGRLYRKFQKKFYLKTFWGVRASTRGSRRKKNLRQKFK